MTGAVRSLHSHVLMGVLLAACAAATAAQGAAPEIMPPADVRAGMKGYGLTTLKGLRPQRFEVEVLGRMAGWFPKGDLVLVRMSGPGIDEAGIIAGMSGSPVYVDGKLLGAVAYGWSYSKIPLAGVTPAEDMLRVQRIEGTAADAKAHARQARREGWRRLAERITAGGGGAEAGASLRRTALRLMVPRAFRLDSTAGPEAPAGLLPPGVDPAIRPLPVPLSVRGMAFPEELSALLDGTVFLPVQATAAGTAEPQDVPLEPGMTVGAAFITGDMDISAMGTLTWIDGDRALALGHPLFGTGPSDYPLVLGEVQAIVPLLTRSFKLASSGKVIGRIVQDREPAILARLDERAPMFPCTVRVRGAVNEQYDYRIAGHWQTASMLAYMAIFYSSTRWEGLDRYMLDARAEIRLKGRDEPLVLRNVYAAYSVLPPAADLVAFPLDSLLLNPYEEVEVESIAYDLEVTPGFDVALIESVWVDRKRVEPGGRLTVHVRLRQYRGDEAMRTIAVDVPETARPGSEVQVLVCDALTNRMVERGLDPGFYAPTSFEDLVKAITKPEPNRDLVVRASVMDRGLRYAGAAMPALPPSALSILAAQGHGRALPLVTDIVKRLETPWVLEGSHIVTVTVKEPEPHNP